MISGTHTHSSPGGFMMDVLFDISTLGFVKETFDALVNGISKVYDFLFIAGGIRTLLLPSMLIYFIFFLLKYIF